jgi:NH3-dependent NAD+ synthetase
MPGKKGVEGVVIISGGLDSTTLLYWALALPAIATIRIINNIPRPISLYQATILTPSMRP